MKKIGITGVIGSGKSSVGKILIEMGCVVLDADKMVHELYENSQELKQKIKNAFGTEVVSEFGVSRKNLAKLVFNDTRACKKLEAIVYPFLEAEIKRQFLKNENQNIVFLEAALLHKIPSVVQSLNEIWFVKAPQEVLLQRLLNRGMSKEDANKRITLQESNSFLEELKKQQNEKSAFVLRFIENNESLEQLKEKIDGLLVV